MCGPLNTGVLSPLAQPGYLFFDVAFSQLTTQGDEGVCLCLANHAPAFAPANEHWGDGARMTGARR